MCLLAPKSIDTTTTNEMLCYWLVLSLEIRCVKPLKWWLRQSELSGNVSYYDYIITAQTKGSKSDFCQSGLPCGKLMYHFYLTFWNIKNSKCSKVTLRIPWGLGALTFVSHWISHLGGRSALTWDHDAPWPNVLMWAPWWEVQPSNLSYHSTKTNVSYKLIFADVYLKSTLCTSVR